MLLLLLLVHRIALRGLLVLSDHGLRLSRVTFENVESTVGADQVDAAAGLVGHILVLVNQLGEEVSFLGFENLCLGVNHVSLLAVVLYFLFGIFVFFL